MSAVLHSDDYDDNMTHISVLSECFYNIFLMFLLGECSNKECQYLHIDPQSKIKDCPWYDRGFCKHGKYYGYPVL